MATVFSCSTEKTAEELPVATSWNAQRAGETVTMAPPGDPHAGIDMGTTGVDPHDGLDMGRIGALDDPHAGLDMSESNLEAPDPSRKIDPGMFLAGTLSATTEALAAVGPGAVIFLSVRPVDKKTGLSVGSPLAVEILQTTKLPVTFHLSGAQSMVAGTEFSGDVTVYARVDGDGEASSTMPGDIEGSVQATIPASGIHLVLDTIVQ